jgi:hypothetical protein
MLSTARSVHLGHFAVAPIDLSPTVDLVTNGNEDRSFKDLRSYLEIPDWIRNTGIGRFRFGTTPTAITGVKKIQTVSAPDTFVAVYGSLRARFAALAFQSVNLPDTTNIDCEGLGLAGGDLNDFLIYKMLGIIVENTSVRFVRT